MKLLQRNVAEYLVSEEPCLGAAFCTYTFDPAYFEEHLLRGVLRLRTDPEEQPAMFHEEARRALQDTPVVVLADASMIRPGRRLPFDLLPVHRRTYHPKLALVLYETQARLLIGSCNLTRAGYEENLELAFTRTLTYADPEDALTLLEVDAFLASSAALAPSAGSQLAMVRDTLRRRLPALPDASRIGRDHAVLHSFGRPILDQLFEAIPNDAKLTRVGVLAPFFEADDADIGTSESMESLLASLVERRPNEALALDVGVAWLDAPLAPPPGAVAPMDAHLNQLWAWRYAEQTDDGRRERIEYLVPTALAPKTLAYQDASGASRRWDRAEAETAHEERRLWPLDPPVLGLPEAIVGHLRTTHALGLWLMPTAGFDERGKVRRRPLHAKLFLLSTKRRGKEQTYVLMGSPNASRGAMLRSVEDAGNVELAVLTVVDGAITLNELLPELVRYDSDALVFAPRTMEPAPANLGAWVVDAVHDAAAGRLTVHWASEGPAPLGPWSLRYDDRIVAHGDGPPEAPTIVAPFELSPATAELVLLAGGREAAIPIRVDDLAALPTSATLMQLGLRELLALLGRRVGVERLETLVSERGREGVDALLEAVFGEGFGPVDVFKAWWGIARDLGDPLTVPGFRHRLRGPAGAHAVWSRLRDEVGPSLSADEAWIYGCELSRSLRAVCIPDGPDAAPKQALLDEFLRELGDDLARMRPPAEGRAWVNAVADFYAPRGAHA